jgi:hypothetical protein
MIYNNHKEDIDRTFYDYFKILVKKRNNKSLKKIHKLKTLYLRKFFKIKNISKYIWY